MEYFTAAQAFTQAIKNLHTLLKPLGFKKKGNYDTQNLDQKLINYCQEHNILGITQKDS